MEPSPPLILSGPNSIFSERIRNGSFLTGFTPTRTRQTVSECSASPNSLATQQRFTTYSTDHRMTPVDPSDFGTNLTLASLKYKDPNQSYPLGKGHQLEYIDEYNLLPSPRRALNQLTSRSSITMASIHSSPTTALNVDVPRKRNGIRLAAVIPFSLSTVAFTLTFLAVLSGTQPNMFEDGDMATVKFRLLNSSCTLT